MTDPDQTGYAACQLLIWIGVAAVIMWLLSYTIRSALDYHDKHKGKPE